MQGKWRAAPVIRDDTLASSFSGVTLVTTKDDGPVIQPLGLNLNIILHSDTLAVPISFSNITHAIHMTDKAQLIFSGRQKWLNLTGACVLSHKRVGPCQRVNWCCLCNYLSFTVRFRLILPVPPSCPPSPLVQTSLCQGLPDKRWHTKLQTQCKMENCNGTIEI